MAVASSLVEVVACLVDLGVASYQAEGLVGELVGLEALEVASSVAVEVVELEAYLAIEGLAAYQRGAHLAHQGPLHQRG